MNSGMIRRIDDLGRIVIPKEIRKNLHIQDGEPLEINVMDRSIMLTPYSPLPALSIQSDLFLRVMAKELKTGTAICSSTAILSYRNVSLYRTAAFLTKSAAGYSHSSNMNTIRKSLFIWKQPISVR